MPELEQVLDAIRATHADAKEKGLGQGKGGQGMLPCPCCAGGKISYSVAGVNGYIWGQCSTPKCVRWME